MSSNNQTLVQKHRNQWYVFKNVMAESWDNVNTLEESSGRPFKTYDEAMEYAKGLEKEEATEYGIGDSILRKDVRRVVIK